MSLSASWMKNLQNIKKNISETFFTVFSRVTHLSGHRQIYLLSVYPLRQVESWWQGLLVHEF